MIQNEQLAADRKLLLAQRDQLTAALNTWKAAVAARDAALKQAGEDIQKIADERNEAVRRFNDLADKYNAVVKEINGERAGANAAASQPGAAK
jgi:chromosome segregation ATPase